ncbi:hypothetical protein ANN_10702 [Periplaneta americana]|uniref:Uncharacterized protein n=1 Tax=Periplaneta americana TaxID=6978 RepID=A0ABQ8T4N9_PERAM|nr:hypothetical protein ANN_10702 [Periplaneta americana]
MRHVTTRLATHGFHHKVCGNKTYHEPNDKCVCVLCSELCDRYHIIKCKKRQKSIAAYSKDNTTEQGIRENNREEKRREEKRREEKRREEKRREEKRREEKRREEKRREGCT